MLGNYCALLSRLLNGLRVGESTEAINKFIQSGDREVQVRIEKQKWTPGKIPLRAVFIPPAVTEKALQKMQYYKVRLTQVSVRNTCRYHLGFNSHNCRYGYINFLADQGTDALTIAVITKWKNLNMLLVYLNGEHGNKLQRKIALS